MNYVIARWNKRQKRTEYSKPRKQKNFRIAGKSAVFEFDDDLEYEDFMFAAKHMNYSENIGLGGVLFAGNWVKIIAVISELPKSRFSERFDRAVKKMAKEIDGKRVPVITVIGDSNKLKMHEVVNIMKDIVKICPADQRINFGTSYDDSLKHTSVVIALESDANDNLQ